MLVHSRAGRWTAWTVFFVLFVPLFALPLLVVVTASFATNWSGAFPSHPTLAHYRAVGGGDALHALTTSLLTALSASVLALVAGGWAALAAERLRGAARKVLDGLFMLPVAVPSVVVGLSLLVAFSRPPFLLNGTARIVILAHTVLVTAFAHQSVSAALSRLDPAYERCAASLGARPAYVLWRVRIPLLLPSLTAAAGLCFALSMGELSATIMIYPPGWVPLPVQIYGATSRGALFAGAALAVVLMAATLLVLVRGLPPADPGVVPLTSPLPPLMSLQPFHPFHPGPRPRTELRSSNRHARAQPFCRPGHRRRRRRGDGAGPGRLRRAGVRGQREAVDRGDRLQRGRPAHRHRGRLLQHGVQGLHREDRDQGQLRGGRFRGGRAAAGAGAVQHPGGPGRDAAARSSSRPTARGCSSRTGRPAWTRWPPPTRTRAAPGSRSSTTTSASSTTPKQLPRPPKTWNDLLDGTFKNKLQYSTPGVAGDGTAVLVEAMHDLGGKGPALDYLKKLQANNVGPSASTGQLAPKVDKGELLVANGDVQMNYADMASMPHQGIFFPAADPAGQAEHLRAAVRRRPGQRAPRTRTRAASCSTTCSAPESSARSPPSAADSRPAPTSRRPTPNAVKLQQIMAGVDVFTPDWKDIDANLPSYVDAWKSATGS